MKPTGVRSERETVIVFNEEAETGTLWTASGSVYNQMLKRKWVPMQDNERSAIFEIPKSAIKLPRPKSKRGFASRKTNEVAKPSI